MRSPRLLNLRCGNHDAVEMSRELCVVAANRGFGDGDTKNAKKIQSFRRDCNSRKRDERMFLSPLIAVAFSFSTNITSVLLKAHCFERSHSFHILVYSV